MNFWQLLKPAAAVEASSGSEELYDMLLRGSILPDEDNLTHLCLPRCCNYVECITFAAATVYCISKCVCRSVERCSECSLLAEI